MTIRRMLLWTAVCYAQRFLDLGRTYAVVVDEILVIDRTGHLRGQ